MLRDFFSKNPYYINHIIISSGMSAVAVGVVNQVDSPLPLWAGALVGPLFYLRKEILQWKNGENNGKFDTRGLLGGFAPLLSIPFFFI